jgi:hypothetical protein
MVVSYYIFDLILLYNNDYKVYYKKNNIKLYFSFIVSLMICFFTLLIHNIYYFNINKELYLIIIIITALFIYLFKNGIYINDTDFIDNYKMYLNKILSINKTYIGKTKSEYVKNFINESNNINILALKELDDMEMKLKEETS